MTTENIVINIREDGARVVIRNIDDIGNSATKNAGKVDILHMSFKSLVTQAYGLETVFRRLISVLAIREFMQMSDTAVLLDARLKMLVKSSNDLVKAQKDIYDIAQKNAIGLREVGTLYTKIYDPVTRMGGGVKETTAIVEAFTTSLRISGASTQEAAAATLQFGQAMSSGRAMGDEFRSMTENNPRVLKAFAEAMNVPVEKLKQMSSEGRLTADVMGNAMIKALDKLRAEGSKLNEGLFSAAFARWHNDLIVLIDDFNKLTGVSQTMTETVDGLRLITQQLSKVMKDELAAGTKVATGQFDAMGTAIAVMGTVLETVLIVASDISFVIKGFGREIGGIAAQAVALAKGDLAQVREIRKMMLEDNENAASELEAYQKRVLLITTNALSEREKLKLKAGQGKSTETGTLTAAYDDEKMIEVRMRLTGINKSYIQDLNTIQEAYDKGGITANERVDQLKMLAIKTYEASVAGKAHSKAVKEQDSDYTNLIKTIKEKVTISQLESQGEDKLTANQKLAAKVMTDFRDNAIKLVAIKGKTIDQQKIEIGQMLELLLATDAVNAVKKTQTELDTKLIEDSTKQVESLDEQIQRQIEHNEQIGRSKAEIEALKSQRLLDSAATDMQTASQVYADVILGKASSTMITYAANLELAAQKKRQLAGVFTEGAALEEAKAFNDEIQKAADKMQNAFEASSRRIENGLYDAISQGGERARKKLILDLKNWFARLVLEPIIKPISNYGASIMNPGAAGAQGSSSSITDMFSAGKTLWEGFSSAETIGGGISNVAGNYLGSMGSVIGSTTLSAFASGLSGTAAGTLAGAGPTIAGSATGLGSLAGAAGVGEGAGVLLASEAGAGAGAAGLGASISSALAAIPVWGWAALAVAAIAAKFGGGKDRVLGDQSISGTLGSSDLTRNVPWTKEGGWFHSDTSGVWNYKLQTSTAQASNGQFYQDAANVANDTAMLKALNDAYANLKTSAADFAKSLGLNADEIMARNDQINFMLGKTEEETKANIEKAFGAIAISMSDSLGVSFKELAKQGETASQTLLRVSTTFTAVNKAFDTLNLKLFETSQIGMTAANNFVDLMGGVEAFASLTNSYYENFYTQEEKTAAITKQLSDEFTKLNVGVLPTTREAYRSLVEELSKTGSPEQLAGVLKLSNSFTTIVPATLTETVDQTSASFDRLTSSTDALSEAAKRAAVIAEERKNLQDQLDELTMSSVQLLQKQRDTVNESNHDLFDQLQATKAKKEADDALLATNKEVQSQIDQLVRSTLTLKEQRALELVGQDKSTIALKQRLFALQDEIDMTGKAKEAADARTSAFTGMMNGMVAAVQSSANAANALADSLEKARNDLWLGSQSGLSGTDKLAIAQDQLKNASPSELPALTKNYLSILSETATSSFEYQRGFGQAVGNIDTQAGIARKAGVINWEGMRGFGEVLAQQKAEEDVRDNWNARYSTYANLSSSNAYIQDPTTNLKLEDMRTNLFNDPYYLKTYVDGSHAGGLDYVPFDGYVAELHKGERVQTANQAQNSDETANEIRILREEVKAAMIAIAKNTAETSNQLIRWNGDGMPETRTWVNG